MVKLESTSQTYGQMIIFGKNVSNTTSVLTKSSINSGIKAGTSPASPFGISLQERNNFIDSPSKISQEVFVNPQDTLVKVIAKVVDAIDDINAVDKERSLIAIAAISNNENATVVVDRKNIVDTNSIAFVGSVQANVSSFSPNTFEYATVLGSCIKSKEEIKKCLLESQKVDLSITLHSKRSESIDFNNLKIPKLEVNFLYNFFEQSEEDVLLQEDQNADPLLKNRPVDVPKYSNLLWESAQVTDRLTGTEDVVRKNSEIRRNIFDKPRGQFSISTTNLPFSSNSSQKRIEKINVDGLKRKIMEMHEPEKLFSAIANDSVFPNKVSITLNIGEQNAVVNSLPYTKISK